MNNAIQPGAGTRRFCSFRMGSRLYGIDAMQVREVSAQVQFTPVPQAPAAVRGLANLRSRIHLVVDLRPMLGLPSVACTSESRLIVLKPALAENLAVLVQRGGDIVHVNAAQIEEDIPLSSGSELSSERLSAITAGVCKLEGELMNVIDAVRLVQVLESVMQ